MATKAEIKTEKKIKVTLIRSTIGSLQIHKATVEALGLKKIRSFNILPNNPQTLGMVKQVRHLVSVEEVEV